MPRTPTSLKLVRALSDLEVRVTREQRTMFRVHYQAADHTATASEIAAAAGVASHGVVNLAYANLAKAVCAYLKFEPEIRSDGSVRWWSFWSDGWSTPDGFVWRMHPQVADAIEQLEWVRPSRVRTVKAAKAATSAVGDLSVAEGRERLYWHHRRERNSKLVAAKKQEVVRRSGRLACEVCDFDFAAAYGSRGEGFAECHHTLPISQSARGRRTCLSELAIVCANCHRMLHKQPWGSVPELRAVLRLQQGE